MIETKDANAFTEVDIIIKNLTEELRTKIPNGFIKMIEDNKNENYFFEFDENMPINEQQILEETKTILTIIYKDFLCSQKEKEELNKKMMENEMIYQDKYSVEKIFENKKEQNEFKINRESEQLALVKYKSGIFKKILKKIIAILKR